MKIGIISDTHDRFDTITQAFDRFIKESVALVVHCGDWTKPGTLEFIAAIAAHNALPLMGVFGNRDDHTMLEEANKSPGRAVQLPEDLEILAFNLESRHIVIYHGHHKPTLRRLIEGQQYDAVLTGHTHKPLIEQQEQTLVINPGSTAFSIPRRKEPRSVAIYDTVAHSARLIYFEAR